MPENQPSIIDLLKYFELFLKQQTTQGICLHKDQMISTLQVICHNAISSFNNCIQIYIM